MSGRHHRRAKGWLIRSMACLQAFLLVFTPCIGYANPLGGVVVDGNAAISSSGATLTVTQSSSRAIINWQSFSVGAGETTRFVQPSASAAVLNRVTGTDPSALMGTLQSNGQVYLINPHGIVIGPNAQINVGAFTASTLDVENQAFMNMKPGGELRFAGDSTAGVVNYGSIRAVEGNIYLIGAHVANHGTLSAPNGTVGMAAGQDVRLVDSAHPSLVVRATGKSLGGTGVHNTGTIEALQAELVAAHGNVYALAINNEGTVRANTVVREGGRIMLRASGGTIRNSGDLIAKGENGVGGKVSVDASDGGSVELRGNVDVSGTTGGGNVDVAADRIAMDGAIRADAIDSGNGGSVVLKADGQADFSGTITARGGLQGGDGGFVEVSGSELLLSGGVFTTAPNGQTGTFLIDPSDFAINGGAGPATPNSIGADTLTGTGYLADNNVVIATDGAAAGTGEIRVNAAVIWNEPTSLTFLAHGTFRAKASIQNGAGTAAGEGGDVNIVAGWDGTTTDFSQIVASGAFGDTTYGGDVFIGDGTQSSGVAVGSRFGATNIAGHDLYVLSNKWGSRTYAQLGFRTDHRQAGFLIDSPITARLTGNLVAKAGSSSGYAQVGHGGGFSTTTGSSAGGSYNGAISITAPGDVIFTGSDGMHAYAQLGHGGWKARGNHSGSITINQAGNLTFTAGSSPDAYAQLGHGGYAATGSHSGDLTITSANDLTFAAGSQSGVYAQLGHGGYAVSGSHTGNITISAAHNLSFTGGGYGLSYAQLGHGGYYSRGNHHGDVTIGEANNLTFAAGGSYCYAQLGHGGIWASGNHTGAILITKANDLSFTAGGNQAYAHLGHGGLWAGGDHSGDITITLARDLTFTAGGNDAYAQLGHGTGDYSNESGAITITRARDLTFTGGSGSLAHAQLGHGGIGTKGDHSGAITITEARDLTFTGGSGSYSFAQLGHGGYYSYGSHSGDVTITKANDLAFTGGGSSAYAQLGHGGLDADGNHSGAITVGQAHDLTLAGSGSYRAYAQLGHGDAAGDTTGTRQGDIDVWLTGEASLVNGTGAGTAWLIGHATTTAGGISNANVTLITGTLDYSNTANSTLATLNQDFANKMVANLAGGHVTIGATNGTPGATGGMLVTGTFDYGRSGSTIGANNLNFLSTSDVRFLAGVQNAYGSAAGDGGQVNVVAGWDGTTGVAGPLDMALVFAAPTSYGNNGGSVFIGDGIQSSGIAVGSRFGATNVAAHDVNVLASTTTSTAFAQLGFRTDHALADYLIDSPITVHMTGDLIATGGAEKSYAHVGHGGGWLGGDYALGASYRGDIEIVAAGDLTFISGTGNAAYVQLGHGGYVAWGDHSGAVTIVQAHDVTFSAGSGYAGYWAYAQLGHGGFSARGNRSGAVTIQQANDLTFTSGYQGGAYAQLGHGGVYAPGNCSGAVTIARANNLTFTALSGNSSYVQLGHGGTLAPGNHTGEVTITEANDLTFVATSGWYTYAQLGHGGYDADGDNCGNITITQAHDLTFTGGRNTSTYAQLGHGGDRNSGIHSGDVALVEVNDLAFTGGSGYYSYAQLGHGGTNAYGDRSGEVTVTQAHDLRFSGGASSYAYAQLGHSGNGNSSGAITITLANDLTFTGGGRYYAHAQLGHGGFNRSGNHSGAVTITQAHDLAFTGGNYGAYAQLGHGGIRTSGNHSGAVTITQVHDVTFTGGSDQDSYAQLGHGGISANGNHSGDITVTAAHNLTFAGGGYDSYAQLGHGGLNAEGDHSGDITLVLVNDLIFTGGNGSFAYAQLGHGGVHILEDGSRRDSNNSGAITIGEAHDLVFTGGNARESNAHLGHGGAHIDGDQTGAITILKANDLQFTAGNDIYSYAQLGHGGREIFGDCTGDITITEAGDLTFVSALFESYAQLGHGGSYVHGDQSGAITITQANDLVFTSGDSDVHAKLGHGGYSILGNQSGDITITQARDLIFTAGRYESWAQLGHGGSYTDGDKEGDIVIGQVRDLTFTGGDEHSFALLGHGGIVLYGDIDAAITITQARDLIFAGGGATGSFAQLGHSGAGVSGSVAGDVTTVQARDLVFTGGDGLYCYAQLGHGGLDVDAQISGNLTIVQTENLTLAAGTGASAYAQIGHGDASGNAGSSREGDIDVLAFGSIALFGTEDNRALVGHATSDGTITGNVTLAVDQADPLVDGGGRLVMNAYSAIDMGGEPNEVRIFDTRRDGPSPALIDDGALINGVVFSGAGTPATINGTWTPNAEYATWAHEQWGPENSTLYTPADLGDPALPYNGPFTFYFLGKYVPPPPGPNIPEPTPEVLREVFYTIAEMFNQFRSLPYWPQGPYTAAYGAPGQGPPDTIFWLNSAQVFGVFINVRSEAEAK